MKTTTYGSFTDQPGSYRLTKIPESGNFEYIYKNKNIFLRVDQFGPSSIQLDPPVGMNVLQRKDREAFSSWKVYFQIGAATYNNFDIYRAKKFSVTYSPEKAIYDLNFGNVEVITEVSIDGVDARAYMNVRFINLANKDQKVRILHNLNLDLTDSSMAIWDKKEWYTRNSVSSIDDRPFLISKHCSVNGDAKERGYVGVLFPKGEKAVFNTYEKLKSITLGFTNLSRIKPLEVNEAFGYEQTSSCYYEEVLHDSIEHLVVVEVSKDEDGLNKVSNHCSKDSMLEGQKVLKEKYGELISRRHVETKDKGFDAFINGFLPQEIDWVADLDRGWPTGMRGTRDASNDFMGYIAYDPAKVRDVIVTMFKSERITDGWFPRQISFSAIKKYDLRNFVDSGAFFIELVYEYLSYTDDWSLLTDSYCYYENDTEESGLVHLIKAASFYTIKDNIGPNGLIKLQGGDWCDCFNRVGLKGKAETLHVTCQAILAFREVSEILKKVGGDHSSTIASFEKTAASFRKAIKACFNEEGFYNALLADDGNWYFSNKDVDGKLRVYTVSNAYCAIAGVDRSKDKKALQAIAKRNRTSMGYKIFTEPFGNPPFEGLGKMSSGDFAPNLLENGSIYNHAAFFLARAFAVSGDHKRLYDVLNFCLPYNQKFHPESATCLPMYALTNSYCLAPTYYGRAALCFLTGSIAMAERTVYNWMFGLDFHPEFLRIAPCLPKEYGDSKVHIEYCGHNIDVIYHGYGSTVVEVKHNGNVVSEDIDKKLLACDSLIEVTLK